jgi:hypothetical protein
MFDKKIFSLFCSCFWIRDLRSGIQDPGSEIRDPGSGIQDLGWVKIRIRDPGSGINIPDPPHWKNLEIKI